MIFIQRLCCDIWSFVWVNSRHYTTKWHFVKLGQLFVFFVMTWCAWLLDDALCNFLDISNGICVARHRAQTAALKVQTFSQICAAEGDWSKDPQNNDRSSSNGSFTLHGTETGTEYGERVCNPLVLSPVPRPSVMCAVKDKIYPSFPVSVPVPFLVPLSENSILLRRCRIQASETWSTLALKHRAVSGTGRI